MSSYDVSPLFPTSPPPLDPNRPFAIASNYDDALAGIQENLPRSGTLDSPAPTMPPGNYQPGLDYLMQRVAGAQLEDLPQLYKDIKAIYMQPGAIRAGEQLIAAASDLAETGTSLQKRQDTLNTIAHIATENPLDLAAGELGIPGLISLGGAAFHKLSATDQAATELLFEEQASAAYDALATDPARGYVLDTRGIDERQAGLAAVAKGDIPGPITRDPSGLAEFIDADGQKWDVKAFNSNYPSYTGGFEVQKDANNVDGQLIKNENVIIDTRDMSVEDIKALKSEGALLGVSAHPLG